jgi:hypothetical protein
VGAAFVLAEQGARAIDRHGDDARFLEVDIALRRRCRGACRSSGISRGCRAGAALATGDVWANPPRATTSDSAAIVASRYA